jgi:hypothetical protein
VIGLWWGLGKPKIFNDYMEAFVNEAKSLISEYVYDKQNIEFSIMNVLVDLPARSYVCLTKGHGGYCSCPKCTIRGKYDHGTVRLVGYCGEARTDETFRLQEDGS